MENYSVLIIDDSEFFLQLIVSFFKRSGCKTLTAKDGKEAFDILKELKPDLILLDYYLPDIQGDECCRKMKADPNIKNVPVIMVTASDKEEDMSKCFEAGCDNYVTKPIDKMELLDKVKKYIPLVARQYERVPIYTQLSYLCFGKEYSGHLLVISEGGAFMMGERLLPEDEVIDLKFTIPGISKSLNVKGKVMWHFKGREKFPQLFALVNGMGVQFTDIGDDAKKAIESYISLGNYLI